MAVVENDYAAYIKTPLGEYPLRDLDAMRSNQGTENAGKILKIGADGNIIPADAVEATIPKQEMEVDDTSVTLQPDNYYIFPEMSTLTITLGSEIQGKANAYWFSFDSGDTATTLSLPETVQTDIVVEPNMHYECMIVGNYMTFEEWEATT